MQPYFFPYIGYFELMEAVDLFVFLTDVQYIRRGWVNRNRIRAKDKPFQHLTVPVKQQHQSDPIKDIQIAEGDWCASHLQILRHTYGKQQHPLLDLYVTLGKHNYLCPMLMDSLVATARIMGLDTQFMDSNGLSEARGQQRIMEICERLGVGTYINLPGGRDLYQPEKFAEKGIDLQFMVPTSHPNKFSVIDLMLGDHTVPRPKGSYCG